MGLRDALASAASAIFNVVSDLCYDVTYKQMGAAAYNTSTGVVTDNVMTTTTIAAVVDKDSRHDLIEEHSDNVDIIVLILASYISGITPTPGDIITLNGTDRVVVDVATDPGKIMWEIGLR